MYRGSVSTFVDLSVTTGAASCHVQRVRFWHLKSADFFGDVVGASLVAVAAAHDWKLDDTKGYQTCLIKASIDSRCFQVPRS